MTLIAFVVAFSLAVLFNLVTIVFGRRQVDAFKEKMSIGTYLGELYTVLEKELGASTARALKIGLLVIGGLFILFNVFALIAGIVGILVGTMVAKHLYRVPAVNNIINKAATYINRSL